MSLILYFGVARPRHLHRVRQDHRDTVVWLLFSPDEWTCANLRALYASKMIHPNDMLVDGVTPMYIALTRCPQAVPILLECGADPHKDRSWMDALVSLEYRGTVLTKDHADAFLLCEFPDDVDLAVCAALHLEPSRGKDILLEALADAGATVSCPAVNRAQLKRTLTRTHLVRAELVEKTWHPSRLFDWCLDIDTLKECNT